jgi:dihydrofolate reductase
MPRRAECRVLVRVSVRWRPIRRLLGWLLLKAKPGGDLQVHGSGKLVRWLLDNQLVDEITLLVCPVVVGDGTRLYPDKGPDAALDLVESRAFPKGITIQVYRPAERPQYATGPAD